MELMTRGGGRPKVELPDEVADIVGSIRTNEDLNRVVWNALDIDGFVTRGIKPVMDKVYKLKRTINNLKLDLAIGDHVLSVEVLRYNPDHNPYDIMAMALEFHNYKGILVPILQSMKGKLNLDSRSKERELEVALGIAEVVLPDELLNRMTNLAMDPSGKKRHITRPDVGHLMPLYPEGHVSVIGALFDRKKAPGLLNRYNNRGNANQIKAVRLHYPAVQEAAAEYVLRWKDELKEVSAVIDALFDAYSHLLVLNRISE